MSNRIMQSGTEEYLKVSVTCDFVLNTQAVAFSFDRNLWFTGEWTGTAGNTRVARVLLGGNSGNALPAQGQWPIYVKVTDTPEVPIIEAGTLTVQ